MKAGQEKQQAAPRLKSHHLHNQGARFVKQQRSNLIQPTWPLRYSPTPVMVPPVPTPLTKMSTCQDRAGWEAGVVGAQPPVAREPRKQAVLLGCAVACAAAAGVAGAAAAGAGFPPR